MQTESGTGATGIEAEGAIDSAGAKVAPVDEGSSLAASNSRPTAAWIRAIKSARNVVSRALQICLRSIETLLWALFFVAAMFFLALRYWVLPNVERYRDEIVAAVSQATGLRVKVDRISADWRGLRPQLELVNVRLLDSGGHEALFLPSVVNVIAWRSLLFLDLRLHTFEVDDLKLSIKRDARGRLAIGGILLNTGKKGDGWITDWVLGQREIVLRNAEIEWQDDLRGAPPLSLEAVNLRLQNEGDQHAVGFSARPPRALGASVEVRAELVGRSITQPKAWNGRLFAEVGNTDLAAWRAWLDYPVDVRHGEGAVRIWATLAEGKLRRIAADLALSDVVAQLGPDLPLLQLTSLQGRLSGRSTPGGFELGTRELRFTDPDGPEMKPTTLRLVVDQAAESSKMNGLFTATLLEFGPLSRVAEALPVPADVRKLLVELAPKGRLLDARFDWRGDLAQPDSFNARSRFAGLGVQAWNRIPGFSGLTGSIESSERRGTLTLASTDATIDLPRVFREPRTALDALTGQLSWERGQAEAFDGGPLRFKLSNLSFANPAFAGTAFGTYAWTGKGPGVIDLSAQFSRADAAQVPRYMPLILGSGLRTWLDSAIVAGVSDDVRLRLRGDLFDFPFTNPANGIFKVTARVRNGVLDYVTGWPRIEGIEANLLFERDRAEFTAHKAGIFGVALSSVRVSIPRLNDGLVRISGQAEGLTTDFLRYVQQSPVRRMVSGLTDPIQANGRGQLLLKLELPLEELAKTKVAGRYQFDDNNLIVDPRLPQIERAAGRVEFTEDSLAVKDVRGRLFGGQVAVSGGTRPEGGVLVTARGEATVAGLGNFFEHPWKRFLSGGTPYTVNVTIGNGAPRVVFESALTGIKSDLPSPLTKVAQATMPLRIEVMPVEGGDRISVSVAKSVNAEFQRREAAGEMVVLRTGIGFNQAARLPEKRGLRLSGTLPQFSLDRWLALVKERAPGALPADKESVAIRTLREPTTGAEAVPAAKSEGAIATVSVPAFTSTIELKVGMLDAFGKRLNDVSVRAGADSQGWNANVIATEMAGELSYRDEGRGKLVARLTHFTLPSESPGARQADDSVELPAVDLVAERFDYRGKHLGRVEVVAQPEGANWRIDKIANVNPEAALSGKGLWVTGVGSRTSLEFNLNISDAGKFLDRVGTPDSLKGGTAKLGGTLTWAGNPLNMDYPSLSGELSLQAESGQFLEIEPGIGKLVSLISLQMLPRRIALDFRDVFSKGFAFDRITSSLRVSKGVLNTKDFRMRGPAADVAIAGDADLANETQNLHVKVVPALGGSASTLVGLLNPVYGVATLIAQQLLKNPLGNIFAFEYAVTGAWSDPKVEKLGVVPVEERYSGEEQFR